MTIQVPTALPLNDGIAESEWSLEEPLGEFEPTYAFGPGQVVRYATARWVARLRFENLAQSDRHLLAAFAAHVGRHRSFWMYDPSHNMRGSFPSTELITPSMSWAVTTDRAATADTDAVRMTRTGATTTGTLSSAALTVVTNAYYAWRGIVNLGAGSAHSITPQAGSTATASNYGAGSAGTTGGRFAIRALPSAGSTMYVNLADSITLAANWTQLGYYLLRRPSVVRALIVDGGSGSQTQTGSSLYVKGLSTSTAGVLRSGDMVEIVSATFSQMVRLTEDVNSDSSGQGFMHFEPMLRKAVSNLDLVIPLKPMVRMRLVTDPALLTRSGWFSNIEIECRESFV